ncbi:M20 metallopeptidase family protein [Streptomyces arboris]|uniref:M20 metallopeptidase family protein n=1 Tax=Streptomyces arboris TaxID=2600619 RepID=UPI001CEFB0C6|nr:M20/M25/M40 family metallo-hydrolase [Streptomyces arboris]
MPLDEELIALRREIHRRPELAGEERETAGLVAEQLRAAGLEVTTGVGGHGVVAVLDGSADGPTVAYRADMDAVDATRNVLPFPRSGRVHDEGFASRVPGVAHLCGHDLHTAIGVGVARTLARSSDQARGRLVFVFQPAEEPLRDARAMLDTGLVQELAPREFYALHCSPYPTGTIAVSPGYGLPGLDQVRIVVPGARRRRPASRPGSRGSARSGFRRTSPRTERTSTRCWTPTWPRTARNPCRSPRGPSRGPTGSRPSASCCASGRRSGCRTYARGSSGSRRPQVDT